MFHTSNNAQTLVFLRVSGHFYPKEHYWHDVGSEELGHLEMIGAIVYQLTKNLTAEEAKKQGFGDYYVDHSTAVYPVNASGVPFTASYLQSTGDVIADLNEDLAADGTIL